MRMPGAMHVQAAVAGVVDDVVLDHDLRAARVEVDTPAAVAFVAPLEPRDVVDPVVVQHRARRHAQRVDAADIAEHAVAEVMDVVPRDLVVVRRGRFASGPAPAQMHAGPAEVADLVVRDPVEARAAPQKHAAGGPKQLAAVVDEVVVHDVVRGEEAGGGIGRPALRQIRASAAQVVEVALPDHVPDAAFPQRDAVFAEPRELAALEGRVPQAGGEQGAFLRVRALDAVGIVRAQVGVGVLEREAAEHEVLDERPGLRGAAERHQRGRQTRRDDLSLLHLLAGQRMVVERALVGVEMPLAGCVERLAHALHVISRLAGEKKHARRPRKHDAVAVAVHLPDAVERVHPVVEEHDGGVRRVLQRGEVALAIRHAEAELILRGVVRLQPPRVEVAPLVRHPRPHPPLAVDEQLVERPPPLAHPGHVGGPQAVVMPAPAGDERPATDHGFFIVGGAPCDGPLLGARVCRREFQRSGQLVAAATHMNRDRPGGLRLAGRVSGPLQAGKRLVLGAGIGVVAVGCHVEFGGLRAPQENHDRGRGEHARKPVHRRDPYCARTRAYRTPAPPGGRCRRCVIVQNNRAMVQSPRLCLAARACGEVGACRW